VGVGIAERPRRSVVGLGANLGDRLAAMQGAVLEIHATLPVAAASRVYATAPVGGPPQGEFLNAAVLLSRAIAPSELLALLLRVERSLGRVRGERWGPRTIDLDLLWIDGVAIDTPSLTVPHPSLRERAFALAPLLELAPDACDPKTGERYVVPAGDIRVTSYSLMPALPT
jgi:2-amino-4-hydroxy-6-hydroxymethyldihydropteridine diphosphokinase